MKDHCIVCKVEHDTREYDLAPNVDRTLSDQVRFCESCCVLTQTKPGSPERVMSLDLFDSIPETSRYNLARHLSEHWLGIANDIANKSAMRPRRN